MRVISGDSDSDHDQSKEYSTILILSFHIGFIYLRLTGVGAQYQNAMATTPVNIGSESYPFYHPSGLPSLALPP